MPTTIATAQVDIGLNTTGLNAQLNNISTQLKNKVKVPDVDIAKKVARNLGKVSQLLKFAFAPIIGAVFGAMYKYLKSNDQGAVELRAAFDRIGSSLTKLGGKLLKIPIFGKTVYQWFSKLATTLDNISTKQLEKAVKLAITLSAILIGLKVVKLGFAGYSGLRGLGKNLAASAGAQAAGSAAGSAAGGLAGNATTGLSAALGGLIVNQFKKIGSAIGVSGKSLIKPIIEFGSQLKLNTKILIHSFYGFNAAFKMFLASMVSFNLSKKLVDSPDVKGIIDGFALWSLSKSIKTVGTSFNLSLRSLGSTINGVSMIISKFGLIFTVVTAVIAGSIALLKAIPRVSKISPKTKEAYGQIFDIVKPIIKGVKTFFSKLSEVFTRLWVAELQFFLAPLDFADRVKKIWKSNKSVLDKILETFVIKPTDGVDYSFDMSKYLGKLQKIFTSVSSDFAKYIEDIDIQGFKFQKFNKPNELNLSQDFQMSEAFEKLQGIKDKLLTELDIVSGNDIKGDRFSGKGEVGRIYKELKDQLSNITKEQQDLINSTLDNYDRRKEFELTMSDLLMKKQKILEAEAGKIKTGIASTGLQEVFYEAMTEREDNRKKIEEDTLEVQKDILKVLEEKNKTDNRLYNIMEEYRKATKYLATAPAF